MSRRYSLVPILALAGVVCLTPTSRATCPDPVALWTRAGIVQGPHGPAPSDNGFGLGLSFYSFGNTITAVWNESGSVPTPHVAGDVFWSYTASSTVAVPIAVPLHSLEVVLFGTGDGKLVCLNATTGALRWSTNLGRPAPCVDKVIATPAVQLWDLSNTAFRNALISLGHSFDDLVFVGTSFDPSCAGGATKNRVYAIYGSNGTFCWTFNNPAVTLIGYAADSPTVDYANNRLYQGFSRSGPFAPALISFSSFSGINGVDDWSDYGASSVLNRPQLLGSTVYVADSTNVLRAFDSAGDGFENSLSRWTRTLATGVAPPRSPWVESHPPFRHTLYVTDGAGALHAVHEDTTSATTSELWSITPSSPFSTGPVVDAGSGKLYLGRNDGVLQQIDAAGGTVEASRQLCQPNPVGALLLDASSGSVIDRINAPNGSNLLRICIPWALGSSGNAGCTVDVEGAVLRPLELLRAEPDPFRSSTMIHFHQSFASRVKIALYDVRGRRVRMLLDEWLDAGEHRIAWDGGAEDGRPLPSGVYLCRLSRGTLMPTVDRPVVLAR